jgi:hypothetical protein
MEKLELENLLALIASHFERNDFKTLTTLLSLRLIWYPRTRATSGGQHDTARL